PQPTRTRPWPPGSAPWRWAPTAAAGRTRSPSWSTPPRCRWASRCCGASLPSWLPSPAPPFGVAGPARLRVASSVRGGGPAPGAARLQRQPVHELVLAVPRVTAGPRPLHLVLGRELQEPLPQVAVLDRLARGRHPAVALPLREPAVGEGLLEVLAVGDDRDAAGAVQRLQGAHRRSELHAVVGGVRLEARGAAGPAARGEQVGPTAAARGRVAGAVGVGGDVRPLLDAHAGVPSSAGRTRRSRTTTAAAWSTACESET